MFRSKNIKVVTEQDRENNLRLIGGTFVLGGTALVVLVARKKYASIIEAAREAGVNDWLRDMADNNLTVVVLTQDLAEKVFTAANAAGSIGVAVPDA